MPFFQVQIAILAPERHEVMFLFSPISSFFLPTVRKRRGKMFSLQNETTQYPKSNWLFNWVMGFLNLEFEQFKNHKPKPVKFLSEVKSEHEKF